MIDRRRFFKGLAGGAVTLAFAPIALGGSKEEPWHLVSPQYFGLHMIWPVTEPYITKFPPVPVGAWRAISPEFHWFSLEPSKGAWKFDKLDIALRLMQSKGVEVMLTLGQTPAWASSRPNEKGPYVLGQLAPPRDLQDWENYIRTVVQRYRGRIRCYELWNEPDVREVDGDRAQFSASQLVELGRSAYRIIKAIDPEALLTTPSFVGGETGVARMEAYLAAGGRECVDVIGFHYYGLPEQIFQYHQGLRQVLARQGISHLPIWNTEFGFLIKDPTAANTHPLSGGSFSRVLPEDEAAAWLARSLIIAASLGIERFFWFMWDGRNLGLVTWVGRKINSAGIAYGNVARWLSGMRISPIQRYGNVVTCAIQGADGTVGWLAWTNDYSRMDWTTPKNWNVKRIDLIDGNVMNLKEGRRIDLSASPVLLSAG